MLEIRQRLLLCGFPLIAGLEVFRGYGPFWAAAEAAALYLWGIPAFTNKIGVRHLVRLRWSVPLMVCVWFTLIFPFPALILGTLGVGLGWALGVTAVIAVLLGWRMWPLRGW